MTTLQYVLFLVVAMGLEAAHQNFGLCFLMAAGLDTYMQVNKRRRP